MRLEIVREPASSESVSNDRPVRHHGGVSLAGAEFGSQRPEFSNRNPGICGRDYIYPSEPTITYFAQQGLGLLRLPFRSERLQPELGQPLDAAELQRIHQVLHLAAEHDAQVILDLHNYARYRMVVSGRTRSVVIDESVGGETPMSRAALADFWRRAAEEFADSRAIAGFGLMNEPHDFGGADWKVISQTAVTSIRSVDHHVTIFVAGEGWSNAHRFEEVNGPRAWIDDPANGPCSEAHCYFDDDATGQYRQATRPSWPMIRELHDHGANRVSPFVEWCRRNRDCVVSWASLAFLGTKPAGTPYYGECWRRCRGGNDRFLLGRRRVVARLSVVVAAVRRFHPARAASEINTRTPDRKRRAESRKWSTNMRFVRL